MRPPIGIMPKYIWLEYLEVPTQPSKEEIAERKAELLATIRKFKKLNEKPLQQWMDELSNY